MRGYGSMSNVLISVNKRKNIKGKGSRITGRGRREVTGFYTHQFSVSQLHGGGAYLLSVATLSSLPSEEGNYQFILHRK